MLCGASEIDLEDKIDGLLELPQDAPVGTNIRDYLKLDDHVIDISITPNRGDCFSIRGIAREIGVINQLTITPPAIAAVESSISEQKQVHLATDGAPRYLGRAIKMSMCKHKRLTGWHMHLAAQVFARTVFWSISPTMC